MANLRGPLLRPMRFREGGRTEDQIRELYNGIQELTKQLEHLLRNLDGTNFSAEGWQEITAAKSGEAYAAGDSVTFGTTSYTQFAAGCRANNTLNFTIPLSRPVAEGVTADVSGKVVVFDPDFTVGSNHYAVADLSNATMTVKTDPAGVTVHAVFSTTPSWYIAQKAIGVQAYGLTVTFS